MSAATTPTSVTLGKSSPFAIICVPTSTRVSPRRNAPSIRSCAPLAPVVSTSMRATGTPGKRARTSSSTFCVPAPNCLMNRLPHSGQTVGGRFVKPQ